MQEYPKEQSLKAIEILNEIAEEYSHAISWDMSKTPYKGNITFHMIHMTEHFIRDALCLLAEKDLTVKSMKQKTSVEIEVVV